MRYILFITLICSFSFAKYDVVYNNIKVGEIRNLETIKEDYLEIDVTSGLVKFLFSKDKFVVYNEDYNGKLEKEKRIKYKKDKYQILHIIHLATTQGVDYKKIDIEKDKYIELLFDEKYYYKYTSKNRIKSEGYLIVKDNKLVSLVDIKNNIQIIKS